MSKIVFTPSGLKQTVTMDTSILSVAQSINVAIRSLCGGNGQCHQCWVEIAEGKLAKFKIESSTENISTLTELERELIAKNPKFSGKRLACQTKILGDLVVEVPEASQEHVAYISKKNQDKNYYANSNFRLINCELAEATLEQNPSVTENLLERLKAQNINATINNNLLKKLQKTIAETKGKLQLALLDESEVVAIYPQVKIQIIGAACDIGSTTLAVYIYDLLTGDLLLETSAMNPQIKFGEDLMSRVSFVMMNKDGAEKLTNAVQQKISELLLVACEKLTISIDKLLQVVLVGNPIMHHLFLGISPVELGQAPFTVATREWLDFDTHELGLTPFLNTRFSFLPLIAGHVGADTTAAILSVLPTLKTKTTLLVDIGTNAEIVLAKNNKIYATSSRTGPAFEGAEISSGVRASFGAIEKIRIDPDSLAVKYKLIGSDFWSDEIEFKPQKITGLCGSGIIEAMVSLARVGLIDKSGLFVINKALNRFSKVAGMSRFLLIEAGDNSIYIEQGDIRSIQLAKAALAAGVKLLMDHQNCLKFDEVLISWSFWHSFRSKFCCRFRYYSNCDRR